MRKIVLNLGELFKLDHRDFPDIYDVSHKLSLLLNEVHNFTTDEKIYLTRCWNWFIQEQDWVVRHSNHIIKQLFENES